jgi:hypothetical protein
LVDPPFAAIEYSNQRDLQTKSDHGERNMSQRHYVSLFISAYRVAASLQSVLLTLLLAPFDLDQCQNILSVL